MKQMEVEFRKLTNPHLIFLIYPRVLRPLFLVLLPLYSVQSVCCTNFRYGVKAKAVAEISTTQITWGEKQLTESLAIVQERSVDEFWKYPTVKYKPDGDKTEDLTLENADSDFTDKGFLYGTINGEAIPVKAKESWKHVFITIMKTLDAEYHSTLKHIAADESITALQDESTKTRTSRVLFGGFYVRLNVSAATLIGYLQDILPELDISLDSVTFHVYSKKKPVDIQSEDINTQSSE